MIALLAKAEYPKAPLELQHQLGWLALLCLTLVLVWVWTRSEPMRRAIFAREDPRLFGLFRIGLGLITFQNFWNLNMHWRMLWTDEGMFTDLEVRKRLARSVLTGWSEADGFLDHWALVKFFWGKHSLLFIHSDPAFVQLYLVALYVLLILFIFGVRARVTAVVLWVMINSLYNRNAVFLEGHDTVFRCVWFLALLGRTDAAWSVDNWLRRKRERRLADRLAGAASAAAISYDWRHLLDRSAHVLWAGFWVGLFCYTVDFDPSRFALAAGAGLVIVAVVGLFERARRRAAHDQGELELPSVRRFELIPAWPRYLYIAQLVCIYTATGMYKTGSVWKGGDALYYALNMDHFYRFEVVTQWVSVFLATNMFRLMTLVTLYWEKSFVLVVVGLILRWRHIHRDAPWYRDSQVWWRKLIGAGALIGAYLVIYRALILAYPWCLALQKNKAPTPAAPGLAAIHTCFAVVLPILIVAWHLLGRWPIPVGKLFAGARIERLTRGRLTRFTGATLDQEFVRAWLFGRRVWLTIGLIFHGLLLTTMNIGMFPVIMMWIYVAFFEARPFLIIGRWLAERLRRRKWTAWLAPKLVDEALSEEPEVVETARESLGRDPTGPWFLNPWLLVVGFIELLRQRSRAALHTTVQRDRERGGRIPDGLVLAILGVAVVLVTLRGLEARTEGPVTSDGTTKAQFVPDARKLRSEAKREAAKLRKDKLEQLGDAGHWWVYAGLMFAAVSHFRRRPAQDRLADTDTDTASPSSPPGDAPAKPVLAEPQLLGGTVMRTLVLGFIIYHCGAVGTTFIPRYPVTAAWRTDTHKTFGDWVRGTNQSQSWKMFAPNPPRSNTFMRTIVIDSDDTPYQVGKDHYSERPYVFWYNDRERKMHRRMVGKGKWYLRYWSQYHCRDWAFNNDGQMPDEVRAFKLKTPIPKPNDLAKAGVASNPRKRKLKTEHVETHKCKPGAVTPQMKQRRGWELTSEDHERLEREAEDREKTAESTRVTWSNRPNFGGQRQDEAEAK